MKISKNKVVSLSYELRTDGKDGEIIQTVGEDNPMMFIFGMDSLIPGFERNVENLTIGDTFAFLLPCEEAYGAALEEAVVEIPKSSFIMDVETDNDLFYEGATIPMTDSKGNRMTGVVAQVKDDSVIMDFNHPLAGDDLFFSGTIVNIREATSEELKNGRLNCSSGSCSGCSGGCN